MKKENIVILLFNFYNQGYNDGYYAGYNGMVDDESSFVNFNDQQFCDWCKKHWQELEFCSKIIFGDKDNPESLEDYFKKLKEE